MDSFIDILLKQDLSKLNEELYGRIKDANDVSIGEKKLIEAIVKNNKIGKNDVYGEMGSKAFKVFVDGGGNVTIYKNAVKLVYEIIEDIVKTNANDCQFIDLGAGGGRLFIPIFNEIITQRLRKMEKILLVEPSGSMREELEKNLKNAKTYYLLEKKEQPESENDGDNDDNTDDNTDDDDYDYFEKIQILSLTAQDFVENFNTLNTHTSPCEKCENVVLSSFTLHQLSPKEREKVFRWGSMNNSAFIVIEFDSPDRDRLMMMNKETDSDRNKKEFVHDIIKRYGKGVMEYEGDDFSLVLNYFLAPMFLKYIAGIVEEKKENYEQPTNVWVEELENSGYNQVKKIKVCPYWWGDCYILYAKK